MRKERAKLDNDVQHMHNRIRMLLLEEHRTLRKIEETRRKVKHHAKPKEGKGGKHLTESNREWLREQARISGRGVHSKGNSVVREIEDSKGLNASIGVEREMSQGAARRTADEFRNRLSMVKKTRADEIKNEKREMESRRRRAQ